MGWQARAVLALVLAAVLAALGGAAATRYWRPKLEAATQRADKLADDVADQNAALEALREAAVLRERAAAAATAAARERARLEGAEAQRIMMLAEPVGDRCVAASELIRRELGR